MNFAFSNILDVKNNTTFCFSKEKNLMFPGRSKMFRCKARKNRIARRIGTYVERCGLQRNAADGHFSTAH
jgi:hypothetical protein